MINLDNASRLSNNQIYTVQWITEKDQVGRHLGTPARTSFPVGLLDAQSRVILIDGLVA